MYVASLTSTEGRRSESEAKEGDSPVYKRSFSLTAIILKYHGARETQWETAPTIGARLNTFSDR